MIEELVLPDGQVMRVKAGLTEEQKRGKFRLYFLARADIAYREGDHNKVNAIVSLARENGIDLTQR